MRYRAGLLDFGLAASKLEGQYQLKCRLATMNILLEDYKDYKTTKCAVLNMKGLLLYFLHEYQHASQTFEEILKLDQTNLNAIKNLQLLYRDLGLQSKADQKERESNWIEQRGSDDKLTLVEATFLGEQAFSILFDCHISVMNSERFAKARELLTTCLKCKDMVKEDRLQWNYWFAQLVFKDNMYKDNQGNTISKYLEPIIKNDVETFSMLKIAALTLQGQLQFKKMHNAELATASFETALSMQKGIWTELMSRYSLFLLGDLRKEHQMNRLRKAKELIDKCLPKELPEVSNPSFGPEMLKPQKHTPCDVHGGSNWFPFSVGCRVYLELFKEKYKERCDHKEATIGKNDIEERAEDMLRNCDTTYLDTAISYGTQCVEFLGHTVEIFNNVGVAYHLKARHEIDPQTRSCLYFTALSHFSHALKHLDGAKVPYVHICHGQCLLDMEEYRPAVECFKRAINCGTKNENIFSLLLESYVQLYLKEYSNDFDSNEKSHILKGILSEASHWLHTLPKTFITNHEERKSITIENILNKFIGRVEEDDTKMNAFASIIAAMFTRNDEAAKGLLDKVIVNFLQHKKLFALKVSVFLLKIPHIDRKLIPKIFTLFDDSFFVNNSPGAEKEFADALQCYRQACCQKDCYFLKKRFDYRAIGVFKEMIKYFKSFSKSIIKEVKKTDVSFASVLSHYLEDDSPDASEIEIKSEDHWASEITVAIHQEIRNERPILSKCLSRIEEDLLSTIDDHFTLTKLCRTNKTKPKCRSKNYQFDFFVLHGENEDDKNFVENDLVPTLEKRYGFKGCLIERDFTPGQTFLKELQEKIQESFKVLVVLTEEFTNDFKCGLFLNMSIDMKKESLIPIQRFDMKDDQIPNILKPIVPIKQFDMERLTRALESMAY